jgi:hypothetical protein
MPGLRRHIPRRPFDFDYGQAFYDSLGDSDLHRYERSLFFFPIGCLRVLYLFFDPIIGKDLWEVREVWVNRGFNRYIPARNISGVEIKSPVYRLIWAIMVEDSETAREIIETGEVEPNQSIFDHLLFAPFKMAVGPFEKDIAGLTPVTIAASLGRHEIFRFLLANRGDPGKKVVLISVKAQFIHLSVNELLLMNAIFHWYKAGRQAPISPDQANQLVDSIILASRKCPSLVSHDHLIENTIRVTWYWGELKEMVGDLDIVKRLVPLNPPVVRELLYL